MCRVLNCRHGVRYSVNKFEGVGVCVEGAAFVAGQALTVAEIGGNRAPAATKCVKPSSGDDSAWDLFGKGASRWRRT